MVDPAIKMAALSALEKALNTAAALNPEVSTLLQQYQGKVVCVACTQPDLTVYIRLGEQCEFIHQADDITVGIAGDIESWIELISSADKASTLINSNLSITGNSQLLLELNKSLAQLDLDWEAHLARLIGDVPAHLIGQAVQRSAKIGKQARSGMEQSIETLVFDRLRLLPKKSETDQFYQRLRKLEMRAERAAARLDRLYLNGSRKERPD